MCESINNSSKEFFNVKMMKKRENLEIFHNLLMEEFQSAKLNIDIFAAKSQKIFESTMGALDNTLTENTLCVYNNTLANFTNFLNILRGFNLEFEKNKLLSSKEIVYPMVKPKYTFPKQNVHDLEKGVNFSCILTHIKDEENCLFYITSIKSSSYREYIDYTKRDFLQKPKIMRSLPDEGEIFGIFLEDDLFRATRENGQINKNNFSAYLLDLGETVQITDKDILYELPKKYQIIEAQAILCRLVSVNSRRNVNFVKYLKSNLYMKQMCKIRKIDRHGLLKVDLQSTNPFAEYNDRIKNYSKKNEEQDLENPLQNPFLSNDDSSDNSPNKHQGLVFPRCKNDMMNTNPNNNNLITFGNLTKEEIDILYEEPETIRNPLKAVMGYVPKDDQRICPFYEPGTDSCFKGPRCRFEHINKLKDGWTRDETETLIDIPNKLLLPQEGEFVKLKPTAIVNADTFYSQIISSDLHRLQKLHKDMNSVEESSRYRQCKTIPGPMELVICRFTDNKWHRARVIDFYQEDRLEVFYVDFGVQKFVPLSEIRNWERKFEYLPFQAVRCKLDGIRTNKSREKEGRIFLLNYIFCKTINAEVLTESDDLIINAYDNHGNNIAELLWERNYVVKIDSFICKGNAIKKPG